MSIGDLSPEVKAFLRKHIHSVWQLELILTIRREPDRVWTLQEIARQLYFALEVISPELHKFVQRGMVIEVNDRFQYCKSVESDAAIDAVAQAYTERRTSVIQFIYSRPLQDFSDAFRLRPEDQE